MKCVKTCRLRPGPAPTAPRPAPLGEMTDRQRDLLDAVLAHLAADGVAPSYRDLADWFTMQLNAVFGHMRALRKKGWLRPSRGTSRGLRLTPAALAQLRSVRPEGGKVTVSLWEPAAALTPAEARRLAADLLAAADAADDEAKE